MFATWQEHQAKEGAPVFVSVLRCDSLAAAQSDPQASKNYGQPMDWQATEMNEVRIAQAEQPFLAIYFANAGATATKWMKLLGRKQEAAVRKKEELQKTWQVCNGNPKGVVAFVLTLSNKKTQNNCCNDLGWFFADDWWRTPLNLIIPDVEQFDI